MTQSPTPTASRDEELLRQAQAAAEHAYIPYSRFPVGAALLTRSGRVVTGCNVENASFGLTICAERTAVTRMIVRSEDDDDRRIDTIVIAGLKAAPCFPCGACRQVLKEFGCRTVIVEGEDGSPVSYPFAEMLPHSFGPEALEES